MHTKSPLLIFINSLQPGGAERVVSYLLKYLESDFDLHLALYDARQIHYTIPKSIKIFDLKQSLNSSHLVNFLKIPFLSYRLSRYCRKHNIQTSVSFLNRPCYINAFMKSFWGYKGKAIMCERSHQSTLISLNSRLFQVVSRKLTRFAYNRADLVLVNSYSSQHDLVENFHIKSPTRVIHNPLDIDSIRSQSLESVSMKFEDGIFYFIAVGGFRKEKNYQMLLDAFFLLGDLPVKLLLVGDGTYREQLKKKTEDLDLGQRVIFAGFDTNPYKYIQHAQCLVLSSDVEGFPNVILEALACRKPVIATDCKSGPREIMAPDTDLHYSTTSHFEITDYGILTPVNDFVIMAEAMRRIYNDQALREECAKKAPARAAQFDIEVIRQYFRLAFSG